MRKTSLDMVLALARRNERIVFIGSDLGPDVLKEMRGEIPDRFFMEGISEAAVIGMAAGLAMDGFMPYVNTIATFLTRRCLEQVAIDICLHKLPVRLIGNGGGVVYAPLGPTHIAQDDMALMRSMPGMTVIAPCDAEEMVRVMEATVAWPSPIYIRLAKGGDRVVSRGNLPFAIGKSIAMQNPARADVLIVSTGVMTQEALTAADALAEVGIACRVLHCHTVAPLDVDAIVALAAGVKIVATLEEHALTGGLASAVLEGIHGMPKPPAMPRFKLFALPNAFLSDYGSQREIWRKWGLTGEQVAVTLASELRAEMS